MSVADFYSRIAKAAANLYFEALAKEQAAAVQKRLAKRLKNLWQDAIAT